MIDIQRYQKLKQEVETAEREAAKAEGALDQLMHNLNEDFGCTTLKQAATKEVELKAAATKSEAAYHTALKEFEDEWESINSPEDT